MLVFLLVFLSACEVYPARDQAGIPDMAAVSADKAKQGIQYCAVFVADHIVDIYYKPWMLSETALTLLISGEHKKARAVLDKAYNIALGLDNPSYKADAMLEVAKGYSRIKEYKKAVAIADAIEAVIPRIKTYAAVALNYYDGGKAVEARELLDRTAMWVENDLKKDLSDRALGKLAETYISVGETDSALDLADKISGNAARARILVKVSEAYLKVNNKEKALFALSEAEKTVLTVEDPLEGPVISAGIAVVYSGMGEKSRSGEFLKRAYGDAMAIRSKYSKPEVLSRVSASCLKSGFRDMALDVAYSIGDDNYGPRALAEAAVFCEDKSEAEKVLSDALKAVEDIRSRYSQASVMFDITKSYVRLGDPGRALEIAGEMQDDYNKPRALAMIANEYAMNGDKAAAYRIFDASLEVAGMIEDNFYKSWALAYISDKFAASGLSVDERIKKALVRIVDATVAK